MKILIVLSHLMTKDCVLEVESVARANLAIEKFSTNEYDRLITTGWAYRDDCETAIADVVKKHILDNSSIKESSITSITKSRDTVGDAFYCLEFVNNMKITKLHVVTSDYHMNRTKIVFNHIFNNSVPIEVFGANTLFSADPSVANHENQSLHAFFQTFKGVDFASRKEIFTAMVENHPFYNGKVFAKVSRRVIGLYDSHNGANSDNLRSLQKGEGKCNSLGYTLKGQ